MERWNGIWNGQWMYTRTAKSCNWRTARSRLSDTYYCLGSYLTAEQVVTLYDILGQNEQFVQEIELCFYVTLHRKEQICNATFQFLILEQIAQFGSHLYGMSHQSRLICWTTKKSKKDVGMHGALPVCWALLSLSLPCLHTFWYAIFLCFFLKFEPNTPLPLNFAKYPWAKHTCKCP